MWKRVKRVLVQIDVSLIGSFFFSWWITVFTSCKTSAHTTVKNDGHEVPISLYIFVGYSKILYIMHFVYALELSTLHFNYGAWCQNLFVNHMLLFSFTSHHFFFVLHHMAIIKCPLISTTCY